MNDFSPTELAAGILLILSAIIYIIRWSMLVHLAIRMAKTEVPQDVKRKRVYLLQILLIISLLIGGTSFYIGLSIPLQTMAVIVLFGVALILLNTRRVFKYVERLAMLKRQGK